MNKPNETIGSYQMDLVKFNRDSSLITLGNSILEIHLPNFLEMNQ